MLERALGHFVDHDLHHLLSDLLLLRGFGVTGSLDLALVPAGEGNAEHTEEVTIGGLCLHESLNQSVPFLDEGAQLVAGDVESIEVGIAVLSLYFLNLESDLSPGNFVVLILQVGKGNVEDTTTQTVSGNF